MVAVSVRPLAVLGSGQKAAASRRRRAVIMSAPLWGDGARRLWRGGAARLDPAPAHQSQVGAAHRT